VAFWADRWFHPPLHRQVDLKQLKQHLQLEEVAAAEFFYLMMTRIDSPFPPNLHGKSYSLLVACIDPVSPIHQFFSTVVATTRN
jgi:hypothetical protein